LWSGQRTSKGVRVAIFGEQLGGRSPAGLLLEIEITERLGVVDHEAAGLFAAAGSGDASSLLGQFGLDMRCDQFRDAFTSWQGSPT
jgi:hypothetical protein